MGKYGILVCTDFVLGQKIVMALDYYNLVGGIIWVVINNLMFSPNAAHELK